MATGSHNFSVLTNSCVKPPVNPNTGLSATLNERSTLSQSFTARDFVDENGDGDKEEREAPVSRISWGYRTGERKSGKHSRNSSLGAVDMARTDQLIEELSQNVDNLNDDDFYQRLLELKDEHKKTLSMCEDLYNQKVAEEGRTTGTKSRDHIRDMSGKPPLARPMSANKNGLRRSTVRAPYELTSTRNAWEQHSAEESDDDEEHGSIDSLNELNESFNGHRRDRSSSYNKRDYSPMSRIDDMWDNFSVEDYAPERARSETTMKSQSQDATGEKEWRHRITIPKPFKMSLRDANKPMKNMSQEQYLKEKAEKERREDLECQKKFKANPAPAHTYLPLFDEIMEEQETKKRVTHEFREELLRSSEKPFKFMQREAVKKKEAHTRALEEHLDYKYRNKKETFKARPVPDEVLENDVADRLREEEEYRKIRKQMRSVEMLRQSKLPPSMAAREEQKRMGIVTSKQKKSSLKAKSLGLSGEPTFRPKVNQSIPDFEEKHRKLMRNMSKKKYEKEATIMKPFNLRTERIPSRKHKVYEDMENDEETLKETRWPYANPRAKPSPAHSSMSASLRSSPFSSSAENIPARMTASQELRSSVTKKKLEQMSDRELEESRKIKERKIREKKLQKFVAEKAAANELVLTKNQEQERLRKIKEQDRARLHEYRRELEEMKGRVESRPLLFEQTSQVNARKAAERKYQETLKNAGIDEDFIQRKSQSYRGSGVSDPESDDEYSRSPLPHNDGLSDGDLTPEGSDDDSLELA